MDEAETKVLFLARNSATIDAADADEAAASGCAGDPANVVGNASNYWSISSDASKAQQEAAAAYLAGGNMTDAYIDPDRAASGSGATTSGSAAGIGSAGALAPAGGALDVSPAAGAAGTFASGELTEAASGATAGVSGWLKKNLGHG